MQSQQRINNPINSSKLLTNKTWDFMLLKILIASVVIFDWWILLICKRKLMMKRFNLKKMLTVKVFTLSNAQWWISIFLTCISHVWMLLTYKYSLSLGIAQAFSQTQSVQLRFHPTFFWNTDSFYLNNFSIP